MSNYENKPLLKKIEETREELIKVSAKQGFTCEETLKISKRLDELLNRYEKRNLTV